MAKHIGVNQSGQAMMKFATTVEIIGATIVGIGVGIEIALAADLGWLLITGGSFSVALGSLLWVKVLRL